jgi:hypothetical protein
MGGSRFVDDMVLNPVETKTEKLKALRNFSVAFLIAAADNVIVVIL